MEDTLVGHVSLLGIAVFLAILNSVIIFQDFSSIFTYLLYVIGNMSMTKPSSTRHMILKATSTESKMKMVNPVVERLSVQEVRRVIDDSASNDAELLFEHEEPSLEEVKEAFDIFDENGDGFIDAIELKKMLYVFGFHEISVMECGDMIRVYDKNGDSKIDFHEFVCILEKSFS